MDLDVPYYPPIDQDQLEQLIELLNGVPGWLEHPACPYRDEIKTFLKAKVGVTDPDGLDVHAELKRLYGELKDQSDVLAGGEASQVNTYFRASVALLEKMITLQERAAKIDQVLQFKMRVLEVLEDICTPDQRTQFMERLSD